MSSKEITPWKIATLGELATIKGGKRLPKGEKFSTDKTSYPYIRVTDFKNGTVDTSDLRYVKAEIREKIKRYVINSENLYISIAGTLGIVGRIPNELDGALLTENAAKIIFSNNQECNKEFYLFYLNSQEPQAHFFQSKGTGGGVPKLALFRIEDTPVHIPPFPEQQKIAKILTSVDEVIEKTQAQIDKLKDLKTGMMQELLTNGIGHTEFKDSPVGRIPVEWEVLPLEKLCSWVGVGIASSTTHAYTEQGQGVVILRNQNILRDNIRMTDLLYITEEFSNENNSKKLRKGDVITIRTGYPGVSAVVPEEFDGCHTFTTLISRPNQDLLNSDYLSLLMNSDYGRNFVLGGQAGGAQQNLNVAVLKTFPVILPSINEQKIIFKNIESISVKLKLTIEKKNKFISFKKALMQDLLIGKVRVNVA